MFYLLIKMFSVINFNAHSLFTQAIPIIHNISPIDPKRLCRSISAEPNSNIVTPSLFFPPSLSNAINFVDYQLNNSMDLVLMQADWKLRWPHTSHPSRLLNLRTQSRLSLEVLFITAQSSL